MWVRWLLLAGLASGAVLAAEEDPPPELLEFLGTFETSAGVPIDPTLLDIPSPEETATKERGDEHD